MTKNVKKRDGRVVPFDEQKIINAILAAFGKVDGEITPYAQIKAENIAAYIDGYMEDTPCLEIEEIQDLVEKGLMSLKKKDVAKEYILYRNKRNIMRGNLTDADLEDLLAGKNDYWNTENSNKNAKTVTIILLVLQVQILLEDCFCQKI